jgi:outer membrane protein insertion porin family
VKRNVKKVSDKYVEKGYFLAEVTSELRPVEGSTEVDVVIVVKENAKVQVKDINLMGVEKVPVAELKAVMATKEGGYLSFLTSKARTAKSSSSATCR